MKNFAHIKNNIVVNIIVCTDDFISSMNNPSLPERYELYNQNIHPWGPCGECDVEIGLRWKDRLKEKMGYCMFCGDGITEPEQSGSL